MRRAGTYPDLALSAWHTGRCDMFARCLFRSFWVWRHGFETTTTTTTVSLKVGVRCGGGGGGGGAGDEVTVTSTEEIAQITLIHSWESLSMKKDGRR